MTVATSLARKSQASTSAVPANKELLVRDSQVDTADILLHAIGTDHPITVDIPTGTPLIEIESNLEMLIAGHSKLVGAAERLRPVIGRILLTISERKLWKPAYKSFWSYLQNKVEQDLGFSHTACTDALRIARRWTEFSVDDYERYGASRLLAAASLPPKLVPDPKRLLEESMEMTVDQFKVIVKSRKAGLIAERPRPKMIAVRCTVETHELWQAVLETFPEDTPTGDVLQTVLDAYVAKRKKR